MLGSYFISVFCLILARELIRGNDRARVDGEKNILHVCTLSRQVVGHEIH